MTMMTMMMMPGNVDDGSSVNCSATYRSKRPSDAVRPRSRSTLNFHLNWSQLVNYRDPVMLFVRDRDPPWIFIWIGLNWPTIETRRCCSSEIDPELVGWVGSSEYASTRITSTLNWSEMVNCRGRYSVGTSTRSTLNWLIKSIYICQQWSEMINHRGQETQ